MHEEYVKRLNYIEGYVKGIRRMVEDDEYCVDIPSDRLVRREFVVLAFTAESNGNQQSA